MLAEYIVIHVNIEILKASLTNIKRDYESFFSPVLMLVPWSYKKHLREINQKNVRIFSCLNITYAEIQTQLSSRMYCRCSAQQMGARCSLGSKLAGQHEGKLAKTVSRGFERVANSDHFFPESFGSCIPPLQIAFIIGCFHGNVDLNP